VSNTYVNRFVFRLALPIAMLAILFYTLRIAEREDRKWVAQRGRISRSTTTTESFDESVPWSLPFAHSQRIQDLIGLQWPAFAAAGLAAPVPEMLYSRKGPTPLSRTSYVVLTIAVAGYWFVIGMWLDRRLTQRRPSLHSKVVRVLLKILTIPTLLLFILFIGKDAFGWPEGEQGAYGITAWLALALTILFTEIRFVRTKAEPDTD
jgi:hypothetical protein